MRIALTTCSALPALPPDDAPLKAAFAEIGSVAIPVVWNDRTVDWAAFDACLIRSTWDYAERRDEFVRWAERVAAQTRLVNPPAIVRWNTDKRYLFDLETAGVPIVPTVLLEKGTSMALADVLDERGWSDVVIKPAVGATARETTRVSRRSIADGQAHLDRLLPHESMLIQPFLPSILDAGEISLMFIDGQFTHAVRKRAVPGDYRVQDDFGGSIERINPDRSLVDLARRTLDFAPRRPRYARVDCVLDDYNAPRVIELELTEPMLYFRQCPFAAARLVQSILMIAGETTSV